MRQAISLRVAAVSPELIRRLQAVPGVSDLDGDEREGFVRYHTTTPERTNPDVIRVAVALGADVLALEERKASLEEVYLALVQDAATLHNPVAETNGRVAEVPQ
jgi:hypothetical protein